MREILSCFLVGDYTEEELQGFLERNLPGSGEVSVVGLVKLYFESEIRVRKLLGQGPKGPAV